ncbi:hypothetical protein Tco_0525647 [Tanacetum coccineum]
MLDYGYNFMQTKIYVDNESAICVVRNPIYHSKTKHIEIRHHFIRGSYEKRLIEMAKIHTDNNVADLLTKAFDVSKAVWLRLVEIINNLEVLSEWVTTGFDDLVKQFLTFIPWLSIDMDLIEFLTCYLVISIVLSDE